MKKFVMATALIFGALTVANANPLYTKCAACHGANGEKVALGKSKIIKDLTKEEFISAMKGYQAGTFGGQMKTIMMPQVKGLSEADIQALADYIIK